MINLKCTLLLFPIFTTSLIALRDILLTLKSERAALVIAKKGTLQ